MIRSLWISKSGLEAQQFNVDYGVFLALLTEAFNGEPALLQDAVWYMFRLRDRINQLVRNPLPGSDWLHAAPTFEIPASAGSYLDASQAGKMAQAVPR